MNPPEWPGQLPGQPGFPPPAVPAAPPPAPPRAPVGAPLPGPPMPGPPMYGPPMQGPPMPGGFPPPPPHRSGGGALVALLIIGALVVLSVAGVGAFVLVKAGDNDRPTITLPTPTAPTAPLFTAPAVEPSPTASSGGTTSDPSSVLSASVRTAQGNIFTRAGTRTESCISRANTKMLSELQANPCIGSMYSAVYANPSRTIITAVSIAKFASPSAASSVGNVTNQQGWPKLLTPSDA